MAHDWGGAYLRSHSCHTTDSHLSSLSVSSLALFLSLFFIPSLSSLPSFFLFSVFLISFSLALSRSLSLALSLSRSLCSDAVQAHRLVGFFVCNLCFVCHAGLMCATFPMSRWPLICLWLWRLQVPQPHVHRQVVLVAVACGVAAAPWGLSGFVAILLSKALSLQLAAFLR